MANPENLAKLKEGIAAWNKWRKDNPLIKLDLSEANLSEANLSEVNLRKADLGYTSLTRAVLKGADLREATLLGANLRGANLRRADLRGANLRRADFAEANIGAANIKGAANLGVEQLCEAKTLYKVRLDQKIEKQVIGKCPHLLETPKNETGLNYSTLNK